MRHAVNRKPHPPPPARTARRLETLFTRKQAADVKARAAQDELALAAVKACDEDGASRSWVAQHLGVGVSTVQGWVRHGRRLRASQD